MNCHSTVTQLAFLIIYTNTQHKLTVYNICDILGREPIFYNFICGQLEPVSVQMPRFPPGCIRHATQAGRIGICSLIRKIVLVLKNKAQSVSCFNTLM